MKKIITGVILGIISLTPLSAKGIDTHFGIGYGFEPVKEKQEFSTELYSHTTHVHMLEAFFGMGWAFAEAGPLEFAAGLEYAVNARASFILDQNKGLKETNSSIKSYEVRGWASLVDQYVNSYIKMKFHKIPFFPITLTGTFGIAFRNNVMTKVLLDINNNAPGARDILNTDKDVRLGYKMGLRAHLSFLYLGMDYTIFPSLWENSGKKANQTFAIMTGFGWSF